jgi:hypothetical protein
MLPEEIRALFTGAISKRTSRLATVLGIEPEDITNLEDAGERAQFLLDKLEGFKFAADAVQLSFAGLAARVKDTFTLAAGTAAKPLFEELKVTLGDIADLFVTVERNAQNAITGLRPRADTIAVLRQVFDAIQRGLKVVQEGLKKIAFEDIFTAFVGLGAILEGALTFFSGFLRGGIEGFSILTSLVKTFTQDIEEFNTESLGEVARLVGQVAVFLGGATIAIFAFNAGLRLAKSPALKLGLAVGAITLGLKKVTEAILGVPVTFEEAGELARRVMEGAFIRLDGALRTLFKNLANFIGQVFNDPVAAIAGVFNTLLKSFLGGVALAAKFSDSMEKVRVGLEDSIGALANLIDESGKESKFSVYSKDELDQDKKNLDEAVTASDKAIQDLAARIAARAARDDTKFTPFDTDSIDDSGVAAKVKEIADNIAETFKGFIGEDVINIPKLKEALTKALKTSIKSAQDDVSKESALFKFADNIVKNFESGLVQIRILVNQLSSFISDTIVDAFDPNEKVDLKERFAKLGRDIARALLQELIKAQIAAIIKNITTSGASDGGQLGLARGGQIGLAGGGTVPGGHYATPQFRPASVAKSDTVNAWLTPKEFVHPVPSVEKYGADLHELMRRGAIDPHALRAVAGLGTRRAAKVVSGSHGRRGPGYAVGGAVADEISQAQRLQVSGGGQVVGAAVVGNNQTMSRLLGGGEDALLDWFSDNASTVDGLISKNRKR